MSNLNTETTIEHRDDQASKLGMWLFIFTELLLFGGLFLVYAVFRLKYAAQFHEAALELNAFIGAVNTVVLLISSMTIAMSVTAMQKNEIKKCKRLILVTVFLGLVFLVNKYFEWEHKIELKLYPGSDFMLSDKLEAGHKLFFSLYWFMTGLHALHIIIGLTLILIIFKRIHSGRINSENHALLENGGLYWHLVDLIWIFLFPLMYLIS